MKSIYVGFSKSKKKFPIASWLIRLYQNTGFSHTYIRLKMSNLPSDKILHASEGLVQNMSGTQFNKKHKVVEEFKLDIPDIIVTDKLRNTKSSLYNALISIMHETAGDEYSLLQNIGILYVKFMSLFKKEVKNPWPKGWNCSEFVASILTILYPNNFKELDPNLVSPKDIFDILCKLDKDPEYNIHRVVDNGE